MYASCVSRYCSVPFKYSGTGELCNSFLGCKWWQAWICLKPVAPSSFQKKSCFTLIQYLSRWTISPFHLSWTTRGRIFWDPTSLPKKTTLSKQSRRKFRLGFPDFWSTKVSTGSGHGLPRTWRLWSAAIQFLFQKNFPKFIQVTTCLTCSLFCFLSFLGNCFKLGFYFQWGGCKLLVYSNKQFNHHQQDN